MPTKTERQPIGASDKMRQPFKKVLANERGIQRNPREPILTDSLATQVGNPDSEPAFCTR